MAGSCSPERYVSSNMLQSFFLQLGLQVWWRWRWHQTEARSSPLTRGNSCVSVWGSSTCQQQPTIYKQTAWWSVSPAAEGHPTCSRSWSRLARSPGVGVAGSTCSPQRVQQHVFSPASLWPASHFARRADRCSRICCWRFPWAAGIRGSSTYVPAKILCSSCSLFNYSSPPPSRSQLRVCKERRNHPPSGSSLLRSLPNAARGRGAQGVCAGGGSQPREGNGRPP